MFQNFFRNKIWIFVFILIVGVGLLYAINPFANSAASKNEVCFKSNCFEVELAFSQQEQYRGLQGRDSLPLGKGMLFVFKEAGIYPFWMDKMKFPLDIIWLNEKGAIVDFAKDSQPCVAPDCLDISPEANASYVLEVNAGTLEKLKLNIGDAAEIKLE